MNYGFNWHHIDSPGPSVSRDNYVRFLLISPRVWHITVFARSLCEWSRSNRTLIEVAARQATMDYNVVCAAFSYFELAIDALHSIRESRRAG